LKIVFLHVAMMSILPFQEPLCSGSVTAIEFLSGSVFNLRTPLVISQAGYHDIRLNGSWEMELIHHKLFHLGYLLSGQALLLGAGKRFTVGHGWFAVVEGMCTASHARIPIGQGHAHLSNLALHAQVGFGYSIP